MTTTILHAPDPNNSGRTIYTIEGPTFDDVALATQQLRAVPGARRFSDPMEDRQFNRWLAHGSVARVKGAE